MRCAKNGSPPPHEGFQRTFVLYPANQMTVWPISPRINSPGSSRMYEYVGRIPDSGLITREVSTRRSSSGLNLLDRRRRFSLGAGLSRDPASPSGHTLREFGSRGSSTGTRRTETPLPLRGSRRCQPRKSNCPGNDWQPHHRGACLRKIASQGARIPGIAQSG